MIYFYASIHLVKIETRISDQFSLNSSVNRPLIKSSHETF
jgi:hypothetical protein